MSTDLTIIPIETPSLGDRSYVVHDGEVAFVVDPQRDIDRVLDVLEEHQVRLTDVFETHIHNDYVTGGLALAQRAGAAYYVNAEDEVSFDRTTVGDGETVEVGSRMRMTALSTPGHTFTHLSYALTEDFGRRAFLEDHAVVPVDHESLQLYALERFLARLAASDRRTQFVLEGDFLLGLRELQLRDQLSWGGVGADAGVRAG